MHQERPSSLNDHFMMCSSSGCYFPSYLYGACGFGCPAPVCGAGCVAGGCGERNEEDTEPELKVLSPQRDRALKNWPLGHPEKVQGGCSPLESLCHVKGMVVTTLCHMSPFMGPWGSPYVPKIIPDSDTTQAGRRMEKCLCPTAAQILEVAHSPD